MAAAAAQILTGNDIVAQTLAAVGLHAGDVAGGWAHQENMGQFVDVQQIQAFAHLLQAHVQEATDIPVPPLTSPTTQLIEYVARRGYYAPRARKVPGQPRLGRAVRRAVQRLEPYKITLQTAMQRVDWQELVAFLAAFPMCTPLLLARIMADVSPRPHLLDIKDAWQLLAMAPTELAAEMHPLVGDLTHLGVVTPIHATFIAYEPLTPVSSLVVPLPLLREWAGTSTTRRTDLVEQANARAAHTHQDTSADHVLQVTPAHLPLLFDLYPGVARTVDGVNTWIAASGKRFVQVPCYTRAPTLPTFPLCLGSVVQPLALEYLCMKYGLRKATHDTAVAVRLRRLASLQHNATFSFPWITDTPGNDADCYLTAFADMLPEDYICWGTLATHTYLSCVELTGWFAERKCLARFDEEGAAYNIAQARALLAVLRVYIQRLAGGHVHRPLEAKQACLARARTLLHSVEALVDARLRALAIDKTLVSDMAALDEEARAAVLRFLRTLQEMAAYCLHWRGPGHPLPRQGDSVVHLVDGVDVETTVYTVAMPPTIDAYNALEPGLRAKISRLRVFVKPSEPGADTVQQLLERLQNPHGVGTRECIRLSARPLWQTACAYAELFFNEALPAFEHATL